MKRRTLLLALSGGSVVSTGAVSELSAERGVSIAASSDSTGFVQLKPITDGTLDDFVATAAGEVTLTIGSLSGAGGNGINTDAVTGLNDLIKVTNPGPNPLAVRFGKFETDDLTAEFYTGTASAPDPRSNVTIRTGAENAFPLNVDQSQNVGLLINSNGSAIENDTDSVTITAGVGVDAGQNG